MSIKIIGAVLAGWILAGNGAEGEEAHFESAGARWGVSSSNLSPPIHQAELFAAWKLPWRWELGSWHLGTRMEASAGAITRRDDHGFVGTVGPGLLVGYKTVPLFLDAGTSITVISRTEFVNIDFGTPFQVTSHGGISWDIGPHFRLGYRFQHMSNVHLASPNPGLNMHMVGASWRF